MNKLTIPALLLGVVMVAGAFAFMPVQEASTVHTSTGVETITAEVVIATGTTTGDFDIIAKSSTIKTGTITMQVILADAGSSQTLTIENCLNASCSIKKTIFSESGAVGGIVEFLGYGIILTGNTASDAATGTFVVAYNAR